MKKFLKNINWGAFTVAFVLVMAGALSNTSVHSFKDWLYLVTFIGIPFSFITAIIFKNV